MLPLRYMPFIPLANAIFTAIILPKFDPTPIRKNVLLTKSIHILLKLCHTASCFQILSLLDLNILINEIFIKKNVYTKMAPYA